VPPLHWLVFSPARTGRIVEPEASKLAMTHAWADTGWITALKNGAIAKLADAGQLQLDLFDKRNLISLTSEDYPGERLVVCRNPELAKLRAEKRKDLITATERELLEIASMVASGKLARRDKIGVRVGKQASGPQLKKYLVFLKPAEAGAAHRAVSPRLLSYSDSGHNGKPRKPAGSLLRKL
jgi:hypothetical protein